MPVPSFPQNRRSGNNNAATLARRSDAELITACVAGEEAAWDALIARYANLIYSVPLRMGVAPADAEDIFQNVCLLLLNHLSELRDEGRIAGWLATTARRETWRRGKARHVAGEVALPEREEQLGAGEAGRAGAGDMPEAVLLGLEEQHLVREGVLRLPDRCRDLLTHLYLADPPLSYQEAAALLGVPIGSIGPVRARCLQRLEKIWGDLNA